MRKHRDRDWNEKDWKRLLAWMWLLGMLVLFISYYPEIWVYFTSLDKLMSLFGI